MSISKSRGKTAERSRSVGGSGREQRATRNDVILRESPGDYGTEKEQIDYRGDQRQQELETKILGSAIRPSVPYLGRNNVPLCFQKDCKVRRSSESLADQDAGSFGSFGPGDGFFFVVDVPAEAADGDGEVAGPRQRCRRLCLRRLRIAFLPPRAQRAGDGR